jgi:HPt (histidine-containing phosphotransfer) domain-containing protein
MAPGPEVMGEEGTVRLRSEPGLYRCSRALLKRAEGAPGHALQVSKSIDVVGLLRVLERFFAHETPHRATSNPDLSPGKKELDPATLRDLLGNEAIASAIVKDFLDDAAQRVQFLRRALRLADRVTIAREAYRLESAAGSVGASVLQELAADVKAAAERGELEQSEPFVQGISESVTRLQKLLPVLGIELARETK